MDDLEDLEQHHPGVCSLCPACAGTLTELRELIRALQQHPLVASMTNGDARIGALPFG